MRDVNDFAWRFKQYPVTGTLFPENDPKWRDYLCELMGGVYDNGEEVVENEQGE